MSTNSSSLVFVCTSCDHNKPVPKDRVSEGASLATAIIEHLALANKDHLSVQKIGCLNGCLKPCNVSLRGRDRATFRFSHLEEQNIGAILDFAALYWKTAEGNVGVEQIPKAIRSKLTIHTPPNGRW